MAYKYNVHVFICVIKDPQYKMVLTKLNEFVYV